MDGESWGANWGAAETGQAMWLTSGVQPSQSGMVSKEYCKLLVVQAEGRQVGDPEDGENPAVSILRWY